ncbi:hypothetical protein [Tomitella fengzijianii]|uniref:hypothetical protein n=1 Tax=Tomitella fengzijianii TaxID=2597660 RepID=UPI00143CEF96|nr:hypothetical protein [Tomitella fengzijianii]
MTDPDTVRERVQALLARAADDADAATDGADAADFYEQAHEVLLEALGTLDRN